MTKEEIYTILQELKRFVAFVASLKYATAKQQAKAALIIHQIENINKPETFKKWNVCLDIFDYDIQEGRNKQGGVYWRQWSVYFERDCLEIEAKTKHSDEPLYHYGDDYTYDNCISFNNEFITQNNLYFEDVKQFVNDAIHYENYITATLNGVEVDIDS